jgi:hypothetical protein
MKCRAIVIAVIKNIVNTCIAEIGAALGSKKGSILGIALGTGLSTALGSILGIKLDKKLGSRLGIELDIDLCSILGIELDKGLGVGQRSTVVDIQLRSKLVMVLGRERCTVVSFQLGSKLGTVLDVNVRAVTKSNINLFGTGKGSVLGLELRASKIKMNISVPTGNRRL